MIFIASPDLTDLAYVQTIRGMLMWERVCRQKENSESVTPESSVKSAPANDDSGIDVEEEISAAENSLERGLDRDKRSLFGWHCYANLQYR
tara:strand:+ start:952 stop:1224 length:273 start_codon:yes stop_codon:yes gene_type:complete